MCSSYIDITFCSYFRDETIRTTTGHTKKMYEVHFPHIFTTSHPYETILPELEDALELPINSLSHVTHNEEARAIGEYQDLYTVFKAAPKFGKKYAWDGSPMGETYRSIGDEPTDRANYMKISSCNKVFPGSLSWWGISPREWKNDDLKKFEDVPHYLRLPPQSRYGNNEFTGELSDMLESYKRSREVHDVYLVIGGTLRYKREICYIVIACTRNDLKKNLRDFPCLSQSNQPILKLNGLVDSKGKGKVVNPQAVPVFIVNHVSPKDSWETLAFAFYFEDHSGLVCDREVIHHEKIAHTTDICVSKKPQINYKPWMCPNDLTS